MSHKKSIYKFGSLGKMKTLRYSQNIVQSSDKKNIYFCQNDDIAGMCVYIMTSQTQTCCVVVRIGVESED